jgi:hypothetical protein
LPDTEYEKCPSGVKYLNMYPDTGILAEYQIFREAQKLFSNK